MSQQASSQHYRDNTWPTARHQLMCRPNEELRVTCSHCRLAVERGKEAGVVTFCGHIFHLACLDEIEGRTGSPYTCPVCKVQNCHSECGCPATRAELPWANTEDQRVPKTKMEGGKLTVNCKMHNIWKILRDMCLDTHRELHTKKYMHEDAPFVMYATDGRQTCWMSQLSFCFDFEVDFPGHDSREVPIAWDPVHRKVTSPGGVKRAWSGFVWEDLKPKIKVYRVNTRPDTSLEACWTCSKLNCPNAPAQRS